ncbi:hypothetical protein AKJ37_01750, partial [candidate division MSBL1 archaeon SCGC-AAA259I09]
MAVRIRVKIRNISTGTTIRTSAIANSGYEADTPEIPVPSELAERLDLSTDEAAVETYRTASGTVSTPFIQEGVKVSLDVEGVEEKKNITTNVAVSQFDDEVLLSDALISEMKVELLDPKDGIWRLAGQEKRRESAEPVAFTRGLNPGPFCSLFLHAGFQLLEDLKFEEVHKMEERLKNRIRDLDEVDSLHIEPSNSECEKLVVNLPGRVDGLSGPPFLFFLIKSKFSLALSIEVVKLSVTQETCE